VIALDITPREWKLLCPPAVAPALSLYQNGFKASHLIAMPLNLNQWKNEMGLTRTLLTQHYKFSSENFLMFIHQDQKLVSEFLALFGFNPFKTYFAKHERLPNPFI
jgi:hypothetical protein